MTPIVLTPHLFNCVADAPDTDRIVLGWDAAGTCWRPARWTSKGWVCWLTGRQLPLDLFTAWTEQPII